MLRIQRHPRSHEVTLAMSQTRSSLQSRTLWLAIAIAIAIHLAAIALFRFPILKITATPSATTAWVELESAGPLSAEANWLPQTTSLLLPPHLLIEREPLPTSPHSFSQPQHAVTHSQHPLPSPAFQQAEGLDSLTLLVPLPPPQKTRVPIRVQPSGPLAERPLLNDGVGRDAPLLATGERSLRYSVRVDAERGEVCWYTLLTPQDSDASTQHRAEAILKKMRFAKGGSEPSLIMGEVEVFL